MATLLNYPCIKIMGETVAIIYRSVSLLSGPSKIFEAEINYRLVLTSNGLIEEGTPRNSYKVSWLRYGERQICGGGFFGLLENLWQCVTSRELLSRSHEIFLQKLESGFRIRGGLLEWLNIWEEECNYVISVLQLAWSNTQELLDRNWCNLIGWF